MNLALISIAVFVGVTAAVAAVFTMFAGSKSVSSRPTDSADRTAEPELRRGGRLTATSATLRFVAATVKKTAVANLISARSLIKIAVAIGLAFVAASTGDLIGRALIAQSDAKSNAIRQKNKELIDEANRLDEEHVARCEKVVVDWLESQRKGREGTELWVSQPWVSPVRLFAVRSWEIVDKDEISGTEFTVRIASSTKAGFPVENLWTIKVMAFDLEASRTFNRTVRNDNPRIYKIEATIKE